MQKASLKIKKLISGVNERNIGIYVMHNTCECVYVSMSMRMNVFVHHFPCIYVCICVHTYTWIYTYEYEYTRTYMNDFACSCRICTCLLVRKPFSENNESIELSFGIYVLVCLICVIGWSFQIKYLLIRQSLGQEKIFGKIIPLASHKPFIHGYEMKL